MSNFFRKFCRILDAEQTSATLFQPEGNSVNKKTKKTLEKSLSKCVDDNQHEWKSYPQLVSMAYRSSFHSVTKYSPHIVALETPLRLPFDCKYETRHTELHPTQGDLIFNTKRQKQTVRAEIDVEQTRRETDYDYRLMVKWRWASSCSLSNRPHSTLAWNRPRTSHSTLAWKLLTIKIFESVVTERRKI